MGFKTITFQDIARNCCFPPDAYVPKDWEGSVIDGLEQRGFLKPVPPELMMTTTFFHDVIPVGIFAKWTNGLLDYCKQSFRISEDPNTWASLKEELLEKNKNVPLTHEEFVNNEICISAYRYLSGQVKNGSPFMFRVSKLMPEYNENAPAEAYKAMLTHLLAFLRPYFNAT